MKIGATCRSSCGRSLLLGPGRSKPTPSIISEGLLPRVFCWRLFGGISIYCPIFFDRHVHAFFAKSCLKAKHGTLLCFAAQTRLRFCLQEINIFPLDMLLRTGTLRQSLQDGPLLVINGVIVIAFNWVTGVITYTWGYNLYGTCGCPTPPSPSFMSCCVENKTEAEKQSLPVSQHIFSFFFGSLSCWSAGERWGLS